MLRSSVSDRRQSLETCREQPRPTIQLRRPLLGAGGQDVTAVFIRRQLNRQPLLGVITPKTETTLQIASNPSGYRSRLARRGPHASQ